MSSTSEDNQNKETPNLATGTSTAHIATAASSSSTAYPLTSTTAYQSNVPEVTGTSTTDISTVASSTSSAFPRIPRTANQNSDVTATGTSSADISTVASSSSSAFARIPRTANQNSDVRATGTSTADISSAASSSSSSLHQLIIAYQQNYASLSQSLFTAGMPQTVNFPLQKRQKVDRMKIHLPLPAKNSVSATIPFPPNWHEHMHYVSQSLAPYQLYPINSMTDEFQKLAELLHPLHINSIDQIVNPKVWNRFVNGRKEMLKAKCNDPMLLRQLGLTDAEIAKKKQSLNFFRHKALDAAPYNDNFVLLFHCTRNPENIEFIQRDGFDERMSRGGMLGKGIYFSDNFKRSIRYDGCGGVLFICGVLLGDCVSNPEIVTTSLMKEPEKLQAERRYIDDNYFDSVNGILMTGSVQATDQYTVYNRYQCCPMYKVNYRPKITADATVIRPPFVWPAENEPYPLSDNSSWAFHAKTIFDAMNGCGQIPPIWLSIPVAQESLDEKLEIIKNLGYTDAELNLKTLKENNFETKPTVDVLLQRNIDEALKLQRKADAGNTNESESETEGSSYHSSTDDDGEGSSYHTSTDEDNPKPSTSKTHRLRKKSVPSTDKDCSICYNSYAKKSNNWKKIPQCDHKLCMDCYKKIEITRKTMTGAEHTFLKCPFCLITSGIEIGICPNGEMTERLISTHCDGYEDCDTIMITYTVKTPFDSSTYPDMPPQSLVGAHHAVRRIAYLPNNKEGQKIFYLLRIAWNRRIIFTIGTSLSTGRQNALVWNIHHKTSQKGGVSCHGYPDATYLDRVRAELKGFGIE
ncbi:uncharacterized protein LOC119079799 isoform X2 [Bradysia coprophila]|uniref:uncharacterized protein LOC119079799 isoform X2 n=1 Tax=Bradysia coprophila TaxID=38358 RepID=UPI00187DA080|nr:uncharacterized protein LOC119079799 isoform X2 [Bradysia coprophila]